MTTRITDDRTNATATQTKFVGETCDDVPRDTRRTGLFRKLSEQQRMTDGGIRTRKNPKRSGEGRRRRRRRRCSRRAGGQPRVLVTFAVCGFDLQRRCDTLSLYRVTMVVK